MHPQIPPFFVILFYMELKTYEGVEKKFLYFFNKLFELNSFIFIMEKLFERKEKEEKFMLD